MKYIIAGIIAIATTTVIATGQFASPVTRDLREVVNADSLNAGIAARAYYGGRFDRSVVVFDVHDLELSKSRVDVMRLLVQFADSQKGRSYERVVLAYRGDHRFFLSGEYFSRLGREYAWQSFLDTFRTMPENVFDLDGTRAFATPTGGMFGVMNAQLEDAIRFHDEWYLDDLLAQLGGS